MFLRILINQINTKKNHSKYTASLISNVFKEFLIKMNSSFFFRSTFQQILRNSLDNTMQIRNILIFCIIAVFSALISTAVGVAAEREIHYPRLRKLTNAGWLSAPHFSALAKRGRFVFREAPSAEQDESNDQNSDNADRNADKRNWRL